MLLLRDFLLGFSIGTSLFPPPKDKISAVIFSWSILCDDGIWAKDFRDFGRAAGSVISSREDIMKKELEARNFLCWSFVDQIMVKMLDIESLDHRKILVGGALEYQ